MVSKTLTELFLKYCQDLKYVIDTTDGVPVPQIAFPVLQWLCLDHLDKLKEICHGQLSKEAFSALKRLELRDLPALTHLWKGPTQLVRLRNLTSLELKKCDKLESMFSLSIARYLMQLQKLDVSKCRKMEVLISSDEEEGDQNEIASTTIETIDKIVFPKLKELYLRGLPSFIALCKAVNGIELLQLNQLILCEILKLNSFCNSSDSNYNTIQPLFNQASCEGGGLYMMRSAMVIGHCNGGDYGMVAAAMDWEGKAAMAARRVAKESGDGCSDGNERGRRRASTTTVKMTS
ncbi:unnamed protein product [Camellia sinensis]